jgi:hypothetical protein
MKRFRFLIGILLSLSLAACSTDTSTFPIEVRVYKLIGGNGNETLFRIERYNSRNKLVETEEYDDSGHVRLRTAREYADTILKEEREYYKGIEQPNITQYDSLGRKRSFTSVSESEQYNYRWDASRQVTICVFIHHNLFYSSTHDTITYTTSATDLKGNSIFRYTKNASGRTIDSISYTYVETGDSLFIYENDELTRIRVMGQNHLIKSYTFYPQNKIKQRNSTFEYNEKGQRIQECYARLEFQSFRYTPVTSCKTIVYDKNGRILEEKIFDGKISLTTNGNISSPETIYRYEYIY